MRIDGIETQAKIIDTAELLFAERGIDSVTFLDLTNASGQRNRNAVKYYFEDKEAILEAALNKHAKSIDEKREAMLAALEAKSSIRLKDIIEAIVIPLADKLNEGDSGIAYIKLNGQLMENPAYVHLRTKLGIDLKHNKRLDKFIKPFIPNLDSNTRLCRTVLIESVMYHGLSSFASKHLSDETLSAVKITRLRNCFVDELVNAICTISSM
jgi:AcrR family transcriptional regulator